MVLTVSFRTGASISTPLNPGGMAASLAHKHKLNQPLTAGSNLSDNCSVCPHIF